MPSWHGLLRRTRFSSCDARRNLTPAAKSGGRLLFLRSKDRRASKTPRKPGLVNGATCKRPEILRLCPPIWRWSAQCSCSCLHPAYVDFDHPLRRLSNRANICTAFQPAIVTIARLSDRWCWCHSIGICQVVVARNPIPTKGRRVIARTLHRHTHTFAPSAPITTHTSSLA